jgi:hypothetical protein
MRISMSTCEPPVHRLARACVRRVPNRSALAPCGQDCGPYADEPGQEWRGARRAPTRLWGSDVPGPCQSRRWRKQLLILGADAVNQ